jgi:hypothetical protein
MKLRFIDGREFVADKEDQWPKHKPKEEKKDDWWCGGHGDDTGQDDDGWITVVSNKNKLITTTLPTTIKPFVSSVDTHVPGKTIKNIVTSPSPSKPVGQDTQPAPERQYSISEDALSKTEKQDRKVKRWKHRRDTLARLAQQEDHFLDNCITMAEDERTVMAEADTADGRRHTIDKAHDKSKASTYGVCSAFKRTATRLLPNNKQVTFGTSSTIQEAGRAHTVHLTYDSGADGHYMSEKDRKVAGMPILRASTKRVGVANGYTCKATNVTQLPFPQLSEQAAQADTFTNFPTSLGLGLGLGLERFFPDQILM